MAIVWVSVTMLLLPNPVFSGVVTLKNGVQFEGKLGKITGIGESPFEGTAADKITAVMLIDDELRRVFVPTKQVAAVAESEPTGEERIKIDQKVATVGFRVTAVGPIIRITKWDQFGRRIFSFVSAKGRVDVVQGITEVTPTYCRVQGILGTKRSYVWDMRIRTSSIPRIVLSLILRRQIEKDDIDGRLRIARLYIQAERFGDAGAELEELIKEFPELKELETNVRALKQSHARRLIEEIQLRADAGQHKLAENMLMKFPVKGVANEILITVRDLVAESMKEKRIGNGVFALFDKLIATVEEKELKTKIETIYKEIRSELNVNTLTRMTALVFSKDDDKLTSKQKLALGISGWILGEDSPTENLAVALDAVEVRNLVREYLRTDRDHIRDQALQSMAEREGSSPDYLAKILANMKPPLDPPQPMMNKQPPGLFEITIPGLAGEPDFTYYVQVPLEYDPYRHYPCVVTLNGAGTTPLKQVDWWAGSFNEKLKMRMGQATRQGYIVVAPKWTQEHQAKYKFTAREHAAVLFSLRDALRRFAIDTDRVFLSGHSMGADAAWDIALAHPDLWAGVIPIVATADKYISRYFENALYNLPMYFVGGQLDGARVEKNKIDFNKYLKNVGYDVVVVLYRGRGHEHFYDEVQNIFKWMRFQKRNFFPKEFKCIAMRPWDNYFFWAELDSYPEATMTVPHEWDHKKSKRSQAETHGRILENNSISLNTSAQRAIVWLTPDMVNFDEPVRIFGNGIRKSFQITPDAKTMLEDVRTRGDRQHPFWAKAEVK
ncbi:MAG: peptidase [Planctomycetes bacterium]|nr:peptidase [Planctomycetota bacterium]